MVQTLFSEKSNSMLIEVLKIISFFSRNKSGSLNDGLGEYSSFFKPSAWNYLHLD